MKNFFRQFHIEGHDSHHDEDRSLDAIGIAKQAPERITTLALATQAIWEMMKERYHVDDIDLANKMEEIDLRDGIKDGKSASVVTSCLGCGRKIRSSNKICIYCGEKNPNFSPFAKVTDNL